MLWIAAALSWTAGGCPASDPAWRVDRTDDQNWLLSLAGMDDRVLVAGGQPGPSPAGGIPGRGRLLVLPDDAQAAPTVLDSPTPGMLWWVHALASAPRVAWLCGESGSVVRYDANAGTPLSAVTTPSRATLYGIWAFSDDDVWAVGGDTGGAGVVLHGGRGGFSVDSDAAALSPATLYKVFAADADHLFFVGQDGTLLRRERAGAGAPRWTRDPSPVRDRLLTVWGVGPTAAYVVGGLGSARLLAFDGEGWRADDAVAGMAGLAGVYATTSDLLITGQNGLVARRDRMAPLGTPFSVVDPLTSLDLHAALVRGGTRWAVGGNLSQYPVQPPKGIVLRQGP